MAVFSASSYALSRIISSPCGSVHSVFNTSFNLVFDGSLLHVGSLAGSLSCIGVTVGAEEMATLLGRLHVGDRVCLNNGVICIYSLAGVSELAVADAPRRDCSVPALEGAMKPGMDVEVAEISHGLGLRKRIGLPWTEQSVSAVSALARFSAFCLDIGRWGTNQVDPGRFQVSERAMRSAVWHLMGRGPGLTPSGDDVLTGFGIGLRYLCGTCATQAADAFFRAVEAALPGRTTEVSESYLRAMCAGQANEDYLAMLALLDSDVREGLPAAFYRVLGMGHTSGADSLLGFAAAFGCLI
ncbi:MAG: DUF2877 domain-containing protein [Collinsella sp.]|nr:DUF2877 domain-containing protein [Collinsella sp.]